MNLFAISGISVGIPCVILAAITFAFGRTRLHRCLMNFNLIVSVWGFGLFLAGIADSHEKALVAWQLAHAGGFFVGPAFYHFAGVFTGTLKKKLLVFSYVQAGTCVLFTLATDLVLNKTRYVYGLHYIQTTPLQIMGLIAYFIFVSVSYWKLITFLPQTRGRKRQQTLYIIFGFMFGFTGATTTFLPMFGIDLLYPSGNFGITLYSIVVTYAILRHNLLDINLVFRRGLAYSLSAGILTGLFMLLALALTKLLSYFSGIDSSTIAALSALSIAILFAPVKNRVQLLIDKLFHKTAIDYYSVIREVSNELASSLNLKHIYGFITDTAFSTFKLNNACLLAANNDHYETMYVRSHKDANVPHNISSSKGGSTGLIKTDLSSRAERGPSGMQLPEGAHLVRLLIDSKKSVSIDESEDDPLMERADEIGLELAPFQGKVAVPIFIDNKLTFLLVLGEKLSGDTFSAGDINMLDTLANQAAMSLKNALLYDDLEIRVEERTRELERTNCEIEINRKKLQAALLKISALIQDVISTKDTDIGYDNPNLVKCYDTTKCSRDNCPCYGKEALRCWQISGTFCTNTLQGGFTEKQESCISCIVFTKATSDPIYEIGEHFNNMLHILETKNRELEDAYSDLKNAQSQMLQREKMASIGQLAAGVAHEINNPTGFILSNLGTLARYTDKITEYIDAQTEAIESLKAENISNELKQKWQKLKLDFVLQDIKELVNESVDGAERIKKIVQNLKSFSRVDEAEYKPADINECIETTLNIVWNELKYNATVEKEYGDIPLTRCFPHQLNQVIMNLLVNAAHAIEKQGVIKIKTWNGDGSVKISISDTGCGIPVDRAGRIFEPFFTTKEVGKGTGLGLSISYDIVKKHKGEITVESEVGKGSTFTVKIPLVEA